ncbi:uncharacterized protein LOC123695109 [Colias croceus]|uniref:uncharacterized protein LOC123695109 n=1 Tax=Colias crocea TaxID=72248 RepID=UPI001E27E849|nr:uncharacterized protein LOC123695109 [Colias croceus]
MLSKMTRKLRILTCAETMMIVLVRGTAKSVRTAGALRRARVRSRRTRAADVAVGAEGLVGVADAVAAAAVADVAAAAAADVAAAAAADVGDAPCDVGDEDDAADVDVTLPPTDCAVPDFGFFELLLINLRC